MAGKEDNLKNRKLAVHCAVLEANRSGAPEAQVLSTPSEDKGKGKGVKRVGNLEFYNTFW